MLRLICFDSASLVLIALPPVNESLVHKADVVWFAAGSDEWFRRHRVQGRSVFGFRWHLYHLTALAAWGTISRRHSGLSPLAKWFSAQNKPINWIGKQTKLDKTKQPLLKKINERTNKQKHKAHCEDSVAPEKTLVCEKRKEEANGIWVVSSALIGAKILKHWDWHTSLRLVAYKFDVSEKFLIDIVKEQSLWVGWQQMMVRKSLFCAWIKRPNRPTCGTFCWIRLDQLADNLQAEGGGGETQKEEQGTSVPESGA